MRSTGTVECFPEEIGTVEMVGSWFGTDPESFVVAVV